MMYLIYISVFVSIIGSHNTCVSLSLSLTLSCFYWRSRYWYLKKGLPLLIIMCLI